MDGNKSQKIKEKLITITLSLLTGGIYLAMKMAKEESQKQDTYKK